LLPLFDDETVLEPRIQDLIEAGFVTASDGYFTITTRGMVFVRCFILLRRVLGLPIGKG
jgi:predicted transcriptional regulator